MEIALRGIGVSPGIAVGPALTFDAGPLEIPKYEVPDTTAEWARFTAAIEAVRKDLKRVHKQTVQALGERHAEIIMAHLMLLDIPSKCESARCSEVSVLARPISR